MTEIRGERVVLRPVTAADVETLRAILHEPAVLRWWGEQDAANWPLSSEQVQRYVVWDQGQTIGFAQSYEEGGTEFRHAGIDLFLSTERQGQGLGQDVVRALQRHLIEEHGHHRIVIDPAADNVAAVACYTACGFRTVGRLQAYQRNPTGAGWMDGLLMEYVTA